MLIIVTTTTTTIIIIIIATTLKGANQDFLKQSPHCVRNCLQHVRSRDQGPVVCKSCAAHTGLITCKMSCTTWYKGTAQLLSLTELKSRFVVVVVVFFFSFLLFAELLTDEGGENIGVAGEKPCRRAYAKMPHTNARKCKPQLRLEPALLHWWQAKKADVLTMTPRVA